MSKGKLALVLAMLLAMLPAAPARAQELWGIYRKGEPVKMILETRHLLEEKQLSGFKAKLAEQLKLKRRINLRVMFPGAPSTEVLQKKYGFPPKYDLRKFYLLSMLSDDTELKRHNSPFIMARDLRETSAKWGDYALASVEPDVPIPGYGNVSTLSSSDCPDADNAPSNRAWALWNMRVPQAWEVSKKMGRPAKGQGIKIGHPDTGYSLHTDLDRQALVVEKGNNFLEREYEAEDPLGSALLGLKQPGHGTATGSVIISRGGVEPQTRNEKQNGTTNPGEVTGVACKATLVPYRAIESVIRLTYGNIEEAMYKAINDGCVIISLSLGGIGHTALNAVMEYAIGNNVIVVAAAGNLAWWPVVYPARYPFCIAVAATDFYDKPWENSAHGEEVTISAPGKAVWKALSTRRGIQNKEVSPGCGTSYSTAQVAGIAALWLAHHGGKKLLKEFECKTKLQFVFMEMLKLTARPMSLGGGYGAGIVNAEGVISAPPKAVMTKACKDFEAFLNQKKRSPESNLEENRWMFNELWKGVRK